MGLSFQGLSFRGLRSGVWVFGVWVFVTPLNKASLSKLSTYEYYKKSEIAQVPLLDLTEIHWDHMKAKQFVKIKGICGKNANSNLQNHHRVAWNRSSTF